MEAHKHIMTVSQFSKHARTHAHPLTSQNVHNQLYVRAELLDVVEIGHRHYWHILVAVHLGDEVHVTGQVFPKDSQREKREEQGNRGRTGERDDDILPLWVKSD